MSPHPLDCQAYVLKAGEDVSKPAVFNESVEKVRSWIVSEISVVEQDAYVIYMGENRTYMSIPQFLQLTKKDADPVNHPAHYNAYNGVEIIDLTEQMNFNRGNAVKYITRAGLKDPGTEIQDLEKARWHIDREIKRLQNKVDDGKSEVAEEPKRERRKVGNFNMSSGYGTVDIVLDAGDHRVLYMYVQEARKLGKYGVMIGKKAFWLSSEIPYGEIWQVAE